MSRWGLWSDARRGALNFIDSKAVQRAVATVRDGRPISLGLPIGAGLAPAASIRPQAQLFMLRDGGDYAAGLPERPGYGYADDVLSIPNHGTTHIDALAHVWKDGLMWDGHPSSSVTSRGARAFGAEQIGPISTRALFVDLADKEGAGLADGEGVSADMLEGYLRARDVAPEPGDALLIRTGWLARWRRGSASETTWAGLDMTGAAWVVDRRISVVGADNISVERAPSGDPSCALPVHIELIRDNGVHLVELLDLEQLHEEQRSSGMLVIAPLNIVGGTGSPVAPVMIL